MRNNLNELNEVLFDTLRGLKDDKIDAKKVQAVIGLGNAIINSAKLQVNAVKYVNGAVLDTQFFGEISQAEPKQLEKPGKPNKKELYDLKLEFAKELGYDNLAAAISEEGKFEFERQFKASQNE